MLLDLVRWLCGGSAIFGGQTWILKGPDGAPLGIHSDSHGLPPGSGTIAHMCNASWLATDYASADDGPTVFVPGSHRYGRATLPHEGRLSETAFRAVPISGKAGSLAIWNGATWPGAAPRTTPGLRVTLVQNYFRTFMRTMINFRAGCRRTSWIATRSLTASSAGPSTPTTTRRAPSRTASPRSCGPGPTRSPECAIRASLQPGRPPAQWRPALTALRPACRR